MKINLQFAPLSSLLVQTAASGGGPVTVAGGSLGYSSLYVDYVYLDTDERRRFAQVSHEYLIEQLQFTGGESVTGQSNKIRLNFNHPVKELLWVVLTDANVRANAFSTYTVPNAAGTAQINPVVDAKLQLNGHDRFSVRAGSYFNLVQPYQHHTNIPTSRGINAYSFGLKPEDHQPSGTCNFSRIDNATLNLTMVPNLGQATVNIYAVNYNVNFSRHLRAIRRDKASNRLSCKSAKHSQKLLIASGINILRNTLLFGKPLRAFHTKHESERIMWQRTHSGTVTVEKIGRSACLLPNLFEYGRASETERVLVVYVIKRLKIQSKPLSKDIWIYLLENYVRNGSS